MIRRIGMLGGGQLGRMLTFEAKRLGFDVTVLEPTENSPCAQVADEAIAAEYDDEAALDRLASTCDVVTFEFENIPVESVRRIEAAGTPVHPGSRVLERTQDRLLEKQFVRSCGLETAAFAPIDSVAELDAALTVCGLPAIIKTRRGGYDGKGQWRVASREEACAAVAEADGVPLIIEGVVAFEREISVIAARGADGTIITFPAVENRHDRGILATSILPAPIDAALSEAAETLARRLAEGLEVIGVFAVECFVAGGRLLVNEIAPRVHNSGHATIEAMTISQFDAQIRAVCGLPLVKPRLVEPAVMVNIIGDGGGDELEGVAEALTDPNLRLHLYGKIEAADRRKMGHFTVTAPQAADALARAEAAAAKLCWQ